MCGGLTPAPERLDFVLWATHTRDDQGNIGDSGRPDHFAKDFVFTDGGFAAPFQDSQIWSNSGNQVGHFLGAVHIGYDGGGLTGGYIVALACYIGHELVSDAIVPRGFGRDPIQCMASQVARYALLGSTERNQSALSMYVLARDADQAGSIALRDCLLQTIVGLPETLQAGSHSGFDDPHFAGREGNSVQDLRLTLKGEVFGRAIRERQLQTVSVAYQWIDVTLWQNRRVMLTP